MKTWAKITLAIGGATLLLCGGVTIFIFRSLVTDDSFLGLGKPVKGLDPAETLRNITGLILPASARVEHFEYVSSLDDYMTLRFRVPKKNALAFMRQRPFSTWERHTTVLANLPTFWDSKPKPPFSSISVQLPNARYLDAYVEENPHGSLRFWISWNET